MAQAHGSLLHVQVPQTAVVASSAELLHLSAVLLPHLPLLRACLQDPAALLCLHLTAVLLPHLLTSGKL
jgi:hypothetical protein